MPNYSAGIGAPVSGFRIGIAPQFFDHLDEEVARVIDDATETFVDQTRMKADAAT